MLHVVLSVQYMIVVSFSDSIRMDSTDGAAGASFGKPVSVERYIALSTRCIAYSV